MGTKYGQILKGAMNFKIWTGKEASYDEMYDALREEFSAG